MKVSSQYSTCQNCTFIFISLFSSIRKEIIESSNTEELGDLQNIDIHIFQIWWFFFHWVQVILKSCIVFTSLTLVNIPKFELCLCFMVLCSFLVHCFAKLICYSLSFTAIVLLLPMYLLKQPEQNEVILTFGF